MRDTEYATSRMPLALGRATPCFHPSAEPNSPEEPENVKIKYPQFENSRLGLTESFHDRYWKSFHERYWKMRQLSCPLSLP